MSVMLISKEQQRYKAIDGDKIVNGAFFTRKASWLTKPVRSFIVEHIAANKNVLDPFAGAGDMLDALCRSYDIIPHGYDLRGSWKENDSLVHVDNPHRSLICTNPPYLAKHSAKRKGVWNNVSQYYERFYDLYEVAIYRSMENATAGVFIVPETFLHSDFSKRTLRLVSVILDNPFTDTENPVCVACFDKTALHKDMGKIYIGDMFSCHLSNINREKYKTKRNKNVIFNDARGNIALKAVDGVEPQDKIRFASANDFYYSADKIKTSSRLLTYIKINGLEEDHSGDFLNLANKNLDTLRRKTSDLILSPFKGNNKSGERRRRLDYALARYIINSSLEELYTG